MHLLTFRIDEPLPGQVLPEMATETSPEEAARRYRAITLTTLRQMKGLANTRLRLIVTPEDGEEAVRFWLLPKLADRWQREGAIFRTEGWEIDFGNAGGEFDVQSEGSILCPNLSARWVHAALLGMGRTVSHVTGVTVDEEIYFKAGLPHLIGDRFLPPLPIIHTDADWQAALDSPLGAAMWKTYEAEI